MDLLKRSLVCKKISYDIKNNLLEKECYELSYTTRYSSGYLARLLLSQFDDVEYDFIINDSIFNGYIKKSNSFINVRFLEYGYNYISYFKSDFKYLNDIANYFKQFIINNNLEKELDCFSLLTELTRIDNLISFCLENKLNNLTYNLYLYFYDEKSNLANTFEKYINSYIESNFNIIFRFNILPLKNLYNTVNDRDALERLEYYDLLKNNYNYEKIVNEIIDESDVRVKDLIDKYSISHRTAYYIKGEYDICNDPKECYIQLKELVKCNSHINNINIIDPVFIRKHFLLSSNNSAIRLSNKIKEIILNELIEKIRGGYYNNEINELLNKQKNENNMKGMINFSKYLDTISKIDLTKNENKEELISKFVEKIYVSNEVIQIKLYPLNKIA